MKSRRILGILAIMILIAGVSYVLFSVKKIQSDITIEHPTVFVHGYKGSYYSFANMLNRFEETYEWGHKALIYEVSPQGEVAVTELTNGRLTEPLYIQVIFRNNRASMQDTTSWLTKVLKDMKATYNMDTVNLVGHSMGGMVTLNYVEHADNETNLPNVSKLITIGTPFGGIHSDLYFQINEGASIKNLKPGSHALRQLRMNKDAIPNDLDVLSIGSTGDQVAVPKSVAMIRQIVDDEQLTYKMIKRPNLGHSALHESPRVDRLVHDFLQTRRDEDEMETTIKD